MYIDNSVCLGSSDVAEQSTLVCRYPLALLAAEDKGQSVCYLPLPAFSSGSGKTICICRSL